MAEQIAAESVTSPLFVWAIFPLADLRGILDPSRSLVMRPWSDTSQDRFLRRFGPVRYSKEDRSQGSVPGWLRSTESWYITANRFARLLPKGPKDPPADCGQGCVAWQATAPRLFADSILNARLELVVQVSQRTKGKLDLSGLLGQLANLDIEVRRSRSGVRAPEREVVKLAALGQRFRDAYAKARAPIANAAARADSDLVKALEPLFVVYDPKLAPSPFTELQWLPEIRTGKASFRALSIRPGQVDEDTAPIRIIRRTFVRLHCMTGALQSLTGALSEQSAAAAINSTMVRRLESLVQAAEAGSDALRARPEQAMGALSVVGERFGAATSGLALRLITLNGTPPTQVMTGLAGRQAAQEPLLLDEELREIYELMIEFGLFKRKDRLLTGLANALIAKLKVYEEPAQQLWVDLNSLNQMNSSDTMFPLSIYLKNATDALAGIPDRAQKFETFAKAVLAAKATRAKQLDTSKAIGPD